MQGIPLAALLDGFQAGRVYTLSLLIEEARGANAVDDLFDALAELDAYSHELRNCVTCCVHPNAVKHRLRRLAALTDFDESPDSAGTLAHTVRWWWSLRCWLA